MEHMTATQVIAERETMLASIKPALSPLMQKALEIKLGHERDSLMEIELETRATAERQARRADVLNPQLFRKRRLPAH